MVWTGSIAFFHILGSILGLGDLIFQIFFNPQAFNDKKLQNGPEIRTLFWASNLESFLAFFVVFWKFMSAVFVCVFKRVPDRF